MAGDRETAATVEEAEAYLKVHIDAAPYIDDGDLRHAAAEEEKVAEAEDHPRRRRHRKLSDSSKPCDPHLRPPWRPPWNTSTTSRHSHRAGSPLATTLHRSGTAPIAFPQVVPPVAAPSSAGSSGNRRRPPASARCGSGPLDLELRDIAARKRPRRRKRRQPAYWHDALCRSCRGPRERVQGLGGGEAQRVWAS